MILHIMTLDKFLPPFIDFVEQYFDITKHKFIFINEREYKYGLQDRESIEFLNSDAELLELLKYMQKSSKIILHGLWRDRVNTILLENEQLLEKSYWVMWGGDFYFPHKQNREKKELIKRVAHLVTGTKGEIEYVQKHYGATGEHIKAFVYTSNLYKETPLIDKKDDSINILVGNSANPTNNHLEIFDKLLEHKEKKINIFTPLSYGDFRYAMRVMKSGYEYFGERFKPIIDFMDEDKYNKFLSTIDIAIFNHNRQQGMGNIITLLGMGKKVYMRSNVTTWDLFEYNGIKLFDVDAISVDLLQSSVGDKNMSRVKEIFSTTNFIDELRYLFDV